MITRRVRSDPRNTYFNVLGRGLSSNVGGHSVDERVGECVRAGNFSI